jgi:N-methylhydantoinase A
VNHLITGLERKAVILMRDEGFAHAEIEVARTGHFQFKGQIHELPVTLPARPLTVTDGNRLADEFRNVYERIYGKGTAWRGAAVQLVSVTLTVVGRVPRPVPVALGAHPVDPASILSGERDVYLPDTRRSMPSAGVRWPPVHGWHRRRRAGHHR